MFNADHPAARAEAQEGLLDFLYQLPVAVIQIDAAGRIALMNPRAVAFSQILGLPCVGAEAERRLLQELDGQLATQTRESLDHLGIITSRRPMIRHDIDGTCRHLALTVQVVNPGSCMVTLEDVTDLYAAFQAQRETQRRYRDIVEVIPAGVVMHGPASDIRVANAETPAF